MVLYSVGLSAALFLAASIVFIGFFGVINRRASVIMILISFELILLGININFIFASYFLDDIIGYIFSLFILVVAASESSLGLAILISYFRLTGTINIGGLRNIKS